MENEVWIALVDGKIKSGVLGIFTSSKAAFECVDRCKELFPDRIAWAQYSRVDHKPTDFGIEDLTRAIDSYEYDEED